MTRRRRTLDARRAAGPPEPVLVAIRMACTEVDDEAQIAEARRQSHDALLASLGDRRRGAVHWRWYAKPAERAGALDVVREGELYEDSEWDTVEQWFVDHPAGVLVLAMCDAVKDPA